MKKTIFKKKVFVKLIIVAIIAAILVVGIRSYLLKQQTPAEINVVSTQAYGHITLAGTIYKETAVGVPGPYLLINVAGNTLELQVAGKLDNLIGQPVKIEGELVPPKIAGGRQILVVSSIGLNQK